jgi:hypothetical protein
MERLIVYIVLWFFVDDGKKVKRAMDVLYGKDMTKEVKDEVVVPKPKPAPVNDKRTEIIDAINYLKNKPTKTKSDRDKIQMLEVVLKSV